MARYGTKEFLAIEQIERFADRLIAVAELCKDNARAAKELGLDRLELTHHKTGMEGVDKVSKFAGAVYTAYHLASLKSLLDPLETQERVGNPKLLKAEEAVANLKTNRKARKAKND